MSLTVNTPTITRTGESNQNTLPEQIVRLYESEADLVELPSVLFSTIAALVDAEAVTYLEHHRASGGSRSLASFALDPEADARAMESYGRHMGSHRFWQADPEFFGTRALRESDFFDERTFGALPIARDLLLPCGARHTIAIVVQQEGYDLRLAGHRSGPAPFSDADRDRLQAFRAHASRAYRQAQARTLTRLSPAERLGLAFPGLSQRQVEVASWLAQGKSNEEIAQILSIGIDTVKAHVKAVFNKIGLESRLGVAIVAHSIPPFSVLPPLWRLPAPRARPRFRRVGA